MENRTIKRMFDACYQAKRIRELLPPLPSGVRSTFIQYLDAIQMLEKDDVSVKISDISDALNLPRPGVTRTVKEMEEKGFLQKIASPDDGRVTYITITEAGKELHQKFDAQYFEHASTLYGRDIGRGCSEYDPDNRKILSDYEREERIRWQQIRQILHREAF